MSKKLNILILLLSFIPYIIIFTGVYLIKNAFAALLTYNTVILIIYFCIRKEKINKELMKIRNPLFSTGLFLICAFSGIMIIMFWNHIKIDNLNITSEINAFGINEFSRYVFILLFSTLNPVAEELFWRLADNSGKMINLIRDVLFAGYHFLFLVLIVKVFFALSVCIILFIISIIWRYLITDKKDLLTVLISHAIADFSIISTILVLR